MDRRDMKVYRIKHKPSGLYYDIHKHKLSDNGAIVDMLPYADIGLVMAREKYHKQYHPSEFEIIEYELKD